MADDALPSLQVTVSPLTSPAPTPSSVGSTASRRTRKRKVLVSPLIVKNSTHKPPKPTPPPTREEATRNPPWWRNTYSMPSSSTLGAHAAGPSSPTEDAFGAVVDLTPRTRYSREVGSTKYNAFVTGLRSVESHPAAEDGGGGAGAGVGPRKRRRRRALSEDNGSKPRRTNPFASAVPPLYPCAAVSAQGPRPSNEDAHQVVGAVGGNRALSFYCVYDGHGGHAAIDYCVHHLCENFSGHAEAGVKPGIALKSAFLATDAGFKATRASKAAPLDGACAVTVVALDRTLTVAHVGDCRAVLLRRGGVVEQLTADHKPHAAPEMDRIKAATDAVTLSKLQGFLSFSRSIGDAGHDIVVAEPDVHQWELRGGDEMLVLATDGLWDVVAVDKLYGLVVDKGKLPDPRTVAQRLVSEAQFRDTADNVTVMCLDLRVRTVWPPTPPAAAAPPPPAAATPAAPRVEPSFPPPEPPAAVEEAGEKAEETPGVHH